MTTDPKPLSAEELGFATLVLAKGDELDRLTQVRLLAQVRDLEARLREVRGSVLAEVVKELRERAQKLREYLQKMSPALDGRALSRAANELDTTADYFERLGRG